MRIGNRIKKLRELRNFTQTHMAEKLGTTQQTYSRYENDEVEITVNKLIEIAKVLGVKPEEIFMFDDKVMFSNPYWSFSENAIGIGQTYNEEVFKELKQQYQERIADLQKEIERLHVLLANALSH